MSVSWYTPRKGVHDAPCCCSSTGRFFDGERNTVADGDSQQGNGEKRVIVTFSLSLEQPKRPHPRCPDI